MAEPMRLAAIIEREEDGFVSLCPELDIASQGSSIEDARTNLIEALTLFFETADASEIAIRLHKEVFVTQVEVPLGKLRVLSGSEVCRILEGNGFAAVRQRGSHRIMQKRLETTTITVPVPLHDTLNARYACQHYPAIAIGQRTVRIGILGRPEAYPTSRYIHRECVIS